MLWHEQVDNAGVYPSTLTHFQVADSRLQCLFSPPLLLPFTYKDICTWLSTLSPTHSHMCHADDTDSKSFQCNISVIYHDVAYICTIYLYIYHDGLDAHWFACVQWYNLHPQHQSKHTLGLGLHFTLGFGTKWTYVIRRSYWSRAKVWSQGFLARVWVQDRYDFFWVKWSWCGNAFMLNHAVPS